MLAKSEHQPRHRQVTGKCEPRAQEIVIFGAIPTPASDEERLRDRIIKIVAVGIPKNSLHRENEWWHKPGVLPWWEARMRVGGRVISAMFRQAVDELLAEGRMVTVHDPIWRFRFELVTHWR